MTRTKMFRTSCQAEQSAIEFTAHVLASHAAGVLIDKTHDPSLKTIDAFPPTGVVHFVTVHGGSGQRGQGEQILALCLKGQQSLRNFEPKPSQPVVRRYLSQVKHDRPERADWKPRFHSMFQEPRPGRRRSCSSPR